MHWIGLSLLIASCAYSVAGTTTQPTSQPTTQAATLSTTFPTIGTSQTPISSTRRVILFAMGDSMTEGTRPGGYRVPLVGLLEARGVAADMRGPTRQPGDAGPTRFFGGAGWTIAGTHGEAPHLDRWAALSGQRRPGLLQGVEKLVASVDVWPDAPVIYLLQIGTNDFLHRVVCERHDEIHLAQDAIARLDLLIRSLDASLKRRNVSAGLIVATLPQIGAWQADPVSPEVRAQIEKFNVLVKQTPQRMKDDVQALTLVVADNAIAVGDRLSDGLHPDERGYDAMAASFGEQVGHLLSNLNHKPAD
jgi:lysophospholipase L1-like esterase